MDDPNDQNTDPMGTPADDSAQGDAPAGDSAPVADDAGSVPTGGDDHADGNGGTEEPASEGEGEIAPPTPAAPAEEAPAEGEEAPAA